MSKKSSKFAVAFEKHSFNVIFIMKKFFSILALALLSVTTWAAASITAPTNDVDFGEVSIKGLSKVQGETAFHAAWQDLPLSSQVTIEILNQPAENCSFNIDGLTSTYVWTGSGASYDPFVYEYDGTLNYYADHEGNYSCQIHVYAEDQDYNIVAERTINVTLVVTNEAVVAKTIPFERIETTSGLHVGDTIVFVCESANAVGGPLNGSYLPAITENVTIDATNGTAQIPETAQMFVMSQYNNNWQLTAVGTTNRLLLDVSDKGAFAYGTPSSTLLAGWGITITNGVAEMYRPSNKTFPVWFNGDRFKPYKNDGSYSEFALYKKAGEAQKLVSSLEVEPINFEEVEQDEVKEVTVAYTATNIDGEILWDIEGTDKALFSVTANASNSTITVKYLGTATKTGAVSAQVHALFENQELDLQDEYFDINLTLIPATVKLTKIEFVDAPDSLVRGGSINLSTFVQYTPNDAADKSLTWSVDKSYQGTVDENGVFTAYNGTGEVTITATSVRVPSVSASVTLKLYTPEPKTITLDKHELITQVGAFDTLTAIVGPNGASQKCWFTSRNTDIITCKKGNANGKGVLTIKALCPEGVWVLVNPKPGDTLYTTVVDSCLVKVMPVTVESISLPESADLKVGMSLQLDPTVTPAQAKDEYTITYVSDNEAVATVDANGKVTAVAEGTAEITATITEGKSATITITVVAPLMFEKVTDAANLGVKDTIILALHTAPVIAGAQNGNKLTALTSDIIVTATEAYGDNALRLVIGTLNNKSGFSLQPVGSNQVLAEQDNDVTLVNTTSTKNLTWEFLADGSNGIYVQCVNNSNAMFKYLAANNAIKPYKTSTVGAELVYVYVRKYVAPAAESVTLNKHELDMHIGDQDVKLKATVAPSDAPQAVVWSSMNDAVATVDANGYVHAVAEGTTKIVVKVAGDETLTDTCVVTISEWKVESITLDCEEEETIEIGEKLTIKATVLPSGHHFDVDFYTSDESIATVTIGGVVTGVAKGDAIITAKSGEKEAKVTIHVIEPAQGINDVKSDTNIVKIIRDGQVLILRNGEVFTVRGERVKGLED